MTEHQKFFVSLIQSAWNFPLFRIIVSMQSLDLERSYNDPNNVEDEKR